MPDAKAIKKQPGEELSITLGSKMIIEPSSLSEKINAQFIGMEPKRFLLLRVPNKAGLRQELAQDEEVTVRFLQGNGLLSGFTSSVDGLIFKPLPLLFLQFPKEFVTMNPRRHDRVQTLVPATILLDGVDYKGVIVNMSKSGYRFVLEPDPSKEPPKAAKGAEAIVIFTLPGSEEEMLGQGVIRNIATFKKKPALGVEFQELTEEIALAVELFVSNIKSYLGA